LPPGVEGRENLVVGYLDRREATDAAQPCRSVAYGQRATQRYLGDVRNVHPGGASISGEVVGKIHGDSRHPQSGGSEWVSSSLCVERLGSHVNAVWPCDSCGFWIDAHLRKETGIPQRLENTSPRVRGKVDIANGAIIE
jgi:hypothetical protein